MPLSPQRVHHVTIHSSQPYRDLAIPRSDIRRLARYLTNTTVGLVLSGGGARGYAHVGVLRAMEELGIPADFIGGTSMGSFVGAVASGYRGDYVLTRQKVKKGASTMASLGNILMDVTLPVVAVVRLQWWCDLDTGQFDQQGDAGCAGLPTHRELDHPLLLRVHRP